jgi:hypothetical protein
MPNGSLLNRSNRIFSKILSGPFLFSQLRFSNFVMKMYKDVLFFFDFFLKGECVFYANLFFLYTIYFF